jgi:predicted DNA repair protein MutK
MIGGAFLCFEGFEKIAHKFLHPKSEDDAHHKELVEAVANPQVDMVAWEKGKVKGAVRTDFILSAEIIVISLGTVAAASFGKQVAVLSTIAIVMTVGVYGLVAGIVKLDDAGLWLLSRGSGAAKALGRGILLFAPWLMKALSVFGTAAMFLVGGGILVHGIPGIEGFIHLISDGAGKTGGLLVAMLADGVLGVAAGGAVLAGVTVFGKLRGKDA